MQKLWRHHNSSWKNISLLRQTYSLGRIFRLDTKNKSKWLVESIESSYWYFQWKNGWACRSSRLKRSSWKLTKRKNERFIKREYWCLYIGILRRSNGSIKNFKSCDWVLYKSWSNRSFIWWAFQYVCWSWNWIKIFWKSWSFHSKWKT